MALNHKTGIYLHHNRYAPTTYLYPCRYVAAFSGAVQYEAFLGVPVMAVRFANGCLALRSITCGVVQATVRDLWLGSILCGVVTCGEWP